MKIVIKSLIEFNTLILKNGLSRRNLAKEAGIGESTILHICGGKRNPSPPVAKKIVEVLKVEFDEIFEIVTSEKE